jgi:hypothetical protein
MGAAKLLLLGWNAATCWICAFLLIWHENLLAGFHAFFGEAAKDMMQT